MIRTACKCIIIQFKLIQSEHYIIVVIKMKSDCMSVDDMCVDESDAGKWLDETERTTVIEPQIRRTPL